jgi:hypothetical protein
MSDLPEAYSRFALLELNPGLNLGSGMEYSTIAVKSRGKHRRQWRRACVSIDSSRLLRQGMRTAACRAVPRTGPRLHIAFAINQEPAMTPCRAYSHYAAATLRPVDLTFHIAGLTASTFAGAEAHFGLPSALVPPRTTPLRASIESPTTWIVGDDMRSRTTLWM